ncbi:MAG TPA: GAF domain-containing protein, partial [Methylomirabilota bacterium]|nr:GAF domain-containing protein [Methylomirabilota bacterium]
MATADGPPPQHQRTRELEALAESSHLLTSTLDLGEVLSRLAEIAHSRLGVDVVRIWLVDDAGDTLHLRAQTGQTRQGVTAKDRLSTRESLSGWVIARAKPLVLADVQSDPRLSNREWFAAEGLVSFLCVPILLDESPIGLIACMTRRRREFSGADVALAEGLAAPAAVAVRNAALYAEALRRVDEIEAFQRVASETLSSPDLATAMGAVAREVRHLLGADGVVCSLVDARSGRIQTLTTLGTRVEAAASYRIRHGEGLAGLVLTEKRPLRTDEYLTDPRFSRTPAIETWARAEGVVSMVAAPVLSAAGEVIALLWAFNRTAAPFSPQDETTLRRLGQQAALAIDKARGFEDERRRAEQTAALLEVARACTSTLELRPLLVEICRATARALDVERCAVFLWRGRHLAPVMAQFADGHADRDLWTRFKALRGQPIEEIPAHAEAIRLRGPVTVTPNSGLLPTHWFEGFGTRTALILPLVSNDRVIGTMGLDDSREARVWDQATVDLAMTIAAQVALAVDTARHYHEAQQRATEVATLAAIGETLTSTL